MFIKNEMGVSICVPGTDTGKGCVLWYSHYEWIKDKNRAMDFGRCFGMASTSSMIYKYPDFKSNLGENVGNIWGESVNLNVPGVRNFITKYHVMQWAYPYIKYRNDYLEDIDRRGTLFEVGEIQEAMLRGDSVFLILGGGKGAGLHAVVPIAITEGSDGTITLYTHDNIIERYSEVSKIKIYPVGGWLYSQEKRKPPEWKFFMVPTNILQEQQSPPMTNGQILIQSSSMLGSVLIKNQLGYHIGTLGGVFVNEIIGAQAHSIVDDSEFGTSEPIYALPSDNEYEIQFNPISGNNEPVSMSQFGLDYAVVIENIHFPNGNDDKVSISSDGNNIRYQSLNGQILDFKMTSRIDSVGYLYQFSSMKVEAGRELMLYKDDASNEVFLMPSSSNPFDLVVKRQDSTGETAFSHKAIQILDARKIAFDIAGWNGRGMLTAQVDYDGDGEYDEKINLRNEESSNGQSISSDNFGFVIFGAGLVLFLVGIVGLIVVRQKRLPSKTNSE
jgi:hypothetical protein